MHSQYRLDQMQIDTDELEFIRDATEDKLEQREGPLLQKI